MHQLTGTNTPQADITVDGNRFENFDIFYVGSLCPTTSVSRKKSVQNRESSSHLYSIHFQNIAHSTPYIAHKRQLLQGLHGKYSSLQLRNSGSEHAAKTKFSYAISRWCLRRHAKGQGEKRGHIAARWL